MDANWGRWIWEADNSETEVTSEAVDVAERWLDVFVTYAHAPCPQPSYIHPGGEVSVADHIVRVEETATPTLELLRPELACMLEDCADEQEAVIRNLPYNMHYPDERRREARDRIALQRYADACRQAADLIRRTPPPGAEP